MFNIEEQKTEILCPKCKFKNSATLKQIKNQESIICGGCKANIKLVDKNGSTNKAIKDVNDSVDKLKKSLKDINIKM